MKELSELLRSRRHHRGSIDFDFPESKITLNGAGRAIDVQAYEANVATEIIEDFMLMANETVAKEYCQVRSVCIPYSRDPGSGTCGESSDASSKPGDLCAEGR